MTRAQFLLTSVVEKMDTQRDSTNLSEEELKEEAYKVPCECRRGKGSKSYLGPRQHPLWR